MGVSPCQETSRSWEFSGEDNGGGFIHKLKMEVETPGVGSNFKGMVLAGSQFQIWVSSYRFSPPRFSNKSDVPAITIHHRSLSARVQTEACKTRVILKWHSRMIHVCPFGQHSQGTSGYQQAQMTPTISRRWTTPLRTSWWMALWMLPWRQHTTKGRRWMCRPRQLSGRKTGTPKCNLISDISFSNCVVIFPQRYAEPNGPNAKTQSLKLGRFCAHLECEPRILDFGCQWFVRREF